MTYIKECKKIEADVLIIGGGTAGCFAAHKLEGSGLRVVIAEKADIGRSGCLAAGVNALNAYITKGQKPQDYVDYARRDAEGIVRGDLLLSMSEGLNSVTKDLEDLGLVILKDEEGNYVARGKRNIKINGENIKTILAKAAYDAVDTRVLNNLCITDYLVEGNRIYGAIGFNREEAVAYVIKAPFVICATGGAAGLYKPNNPGFSKHKMWYSPFNTGAGYAMGIRSGAEMTSFEMRFVALRCKDTIAPTGTIAQGVGAKQVNGRGEDYESTYGITTSQRIYGTVAESVAGRGPCYLATKGIDKSQSDDLLKAYLNMAPSQTLRWLENGQEPYEADVEIGGTEPYIVGGHTASGYWVDDKRETTIKGLYAAGDVAGGCPQKYVTGALVEAEIAAKAIAEKAVTEEIDMGPTFTNFIEEKVKEYNAFLADGGAECLYTTDALEEAMQKYMDEYGGGLGVNYRYSERQLALAAQKIEELRALVPGLRAGDMQELMYIYELKDRLDLCLVLIAHLRGRKETRWHVFNEFADYPEQDDRYLCYVNSKWEDGKLQVFLRDLVNEGDHYEHTN